ncbi:hypothetical protein NE237_004185 [Protea cynaroides]|uniref:ABC transporter domain-containing protein n=1 Tax=Protea cynaroides TaxID=273540 RepID=A0A9Q0KIX2_9MAGN|nr:hypothetical protein NE237_004185 [Protea cynaroides]
MEIEIIGSGFDRPNLEMGYSGAGGSGGEESAVYLVWEDLTVILPNFGKGLTKRLLQGLSGYAEPGRILAIMGPSGSGKSTLLDSLAGRLASNTVMTGNVLINGRKRRLNHGVVAYVTQEDLLLGTLTVRETITYSAHLRFPSTMSKEEINEVVEGTIMEMGLQECADRIIGNWHLRGISGGGETVYFGEAQMAVEFFAEAGFHCPSRRNPSDHFLRCINKDFDIVNATLVGSQRIRERESTSDPLNHMPCSKIKEILVKNYKSSEYAARTKRRIQEISLIEGLLVISDSASEASWWKQLTILTRRSFVNMSRDIGYYWLRIGIYIVVSICVGSIYFDVGTGYSAILARAGCGGFVTGFLTFMSIGGFQSFIEEMKVFYRERLNGHYGIIVFVLSNFLSSLPWLVAISFVSGIITFYMVKFSSEFSHCMYFCLNLFGCIAVIESLMMVVASLVPNYLMGVIIGAGIMGILMMTSGFFRLLPDLPKPFWRIPISYLSYGSWALQGAYKNDLVGLEFDPLVPGDPKLKGEVIIQTIFGMNMDHSKWLDLTALLAILISYRLLFFIILKFKERASPVVRAFYMKRTIKRLNKRPSFRKKQSISKRFPTLHPLSSQEGFNSPIP